MLGKIELPSNHFLYLGVGKIEIKLGENSKGSQLQCLPCRRETVLAVLGEMVLDKIFLRPVQLLNHIAKVLYMPKLVGYQMVIREPARTILHGESLNHKGAQGNFQCLERGKDQHPQAGVKMVKRRGRLEFGSGFIGMRFLIYLQRTQVRGKTKVGYLFQEIRCFVCI